MIDFRPPVTDAAKAAVVTALAGKPLGDFVRMADASNGFLFWGTGDEARRAASVEGVSRVFPLEVKHKSRSLHFDSQSDAEQTFVVVVSTGQDAHEVADRWAALGSDASSITAASTRKIRLVVPGRLAERTIGLVLEQPECHFVENQAKMSTR